MAQPLARAPLYGPHAGSVGWFAADRGQIQKTLRGSVRSGLLRCRAWPTRDRKGMAGEGPRGDQGTGQTKAPRPGRPGPEGFVEMMPEDFSRLYAPFLFAS